MLLSMKRYILYTLIFCLWVTSFASCISEQIEPDMPLPAGMKALTLTIQTADDSPENQSMGIRAGKTELGEDKLNENKIDHFEVFVFNPNGSFNWRVEPEYITRTESENNTFSLSILVKEAEAHNYEGKAFQICVVANHTKALLEGKTPSLDELRQIVETTNLNTGEAQPMFLMDGLVDTKTIQWGSNPIFTVAEPLNLRRAAAKIRLRIANINIEIDGNVYEVTDFPEVKLVHYTNKTSLIQGNTKYDVQENEWVTTDYQKLAKVVFPDGKTYVSTTIPYYAYENNWAEDSEKETYLILKLDLTDPEGSEVSPYYYRIPINYRLPVTGVEEAELYQLKRNYLYDISTNIEVLGNEEESEPLEIESSIAIQPWVALDIIDGSIQNIHYLMVKETAPQLFNVTTREVDYVSDLPINVKINEAYFEWYNQEAQLIKVVWTAEDGKTKITTTDGTDPKTETVSEPYGGATVSHDPATKKLTITHSIPTNFVPFHIDFTVTQVLPTSESGKTPLFEKVLATQFPGKYITGELSPGFAGGETVPAGADFRYHSMLGVTSNGGQKNPVFYKITTLLNDSEELIGDPTNNEGKTKRDMPTNQLISPQFIIASQHGMNVSTHQYISESGKPMGWVPFNFLGGLGPYNQEAASPYYSKKVSVTSVQTFYTPYTTLEERCATYFEGEYGMDGDYVEHYIDETSTDGLTPQKSRVVKKTFKYKGRWRMPTMAELELIYRLQEDTESAVKHILQGKNYFSAYPGWTYSFSTGVWDEDKPVPPTPEKPEGTPSQGGKRTGSVRCVFDTYKLTNHP